MNNKALGNDLKIQFIYKSCFDKDCRSSVKSFHGVGLDEGLKITASYYNKK